MVDVISESATDAAVHIRPFWFKARIVPVLVESQNFVDAHGINYAALHSFGFRPGTHYPIADLGDGPNARFTRSQRAKTKEWVRGKAVVSSDYVGE
jgi:hypothetical protein